MCAPGAGRRALSVIMAVFAIDSAGEQRLVCMGSARKCMRATDACVQMQRTKKGQPVTKNVISSILDKLQKE